MYIERDMARLIKVGRLRWPGERFRLQEQNPCKQLRVHEHEGTRRVGRPVRWPDAVEGGVKVTGLYSVETKVRFSSSGAQS